MFLISSCNSTKSTKKDGDYQLVWSDEFDYNGLPDPTKWDYDTEGNEAKWGNNEAEYYTKARIENAKVENGVLSIVARKENYENQKYTSARIFTKADWKYGKFEVMAKLPAGRGSWAAIWMMPEGWSFNDGGWPDVGEFDIMEHVGSDLGVIHASAHSKDYQWQNGTQKTNTAQVSNVTDKFHLYSWEWTPEVVKAYVDNQLFFEYKNEGLGETKWPYNKAFHLLLNVAIGGAWGSVKVEENDVVKGVDDSAFPQAMEIEYVRVYQKIK
jgi:beta-glucanase (GH16 family)